MLMGSVCNDKLVWKRTRRAQLAKVLDSLCQLGTSVHMQNQFSQPVTVVSQEQLQLLVQPPEACHRNLKLEDAPSYALWQIWVLKTRLKILNHWMLGLQFSRKHQLSKTVEWDKVAQGPGLAGSRWHLFTVKIMCLLIFSFIWKCLLRETSYLVLSWTFRGKNQPCPLWRQDSVRTCQIMNFARSFLGTLMRTILVGCILNGCVIVLSLF